MRSIFTTIFLRQTRSIRFQCVFTRIRNFGNRTETLRDSRSTRLIIC